jgi:DNA (cytosine-5)-methyltransferase 1
MLTYGSLFAGVGGFDMGLDRAGMECRWQVEKDPNCQKLLSSTDGSTHALGCGSKQGQASVAIAIQEPGKRTGKSTWDPRCGLGVAQPGDPMFTLQSGAQHAVAFDTTQITSPEAHAPAVIFQTRIARNGRGQPDEVCPALNGTNAGDSSDMRPVLATRMAVRRLTPKECERLMGWPDEHTAGFSDSTRYKMAGNGVVESCSEWIAKRIAKFS